MKTNWISLFDEQIAQISANQQGVDKQFLANTQISAKQTCEKPKLLLHACCAPCSSYVLELLSDLFEITILYYNPNIHPETEYRRRLNELKAFLKKFSKAQNIVLVEDTYNADDYFEAVGTEKEPELKEEPERGERCRRCYEFRMRRAALYAKEHLFDFFTTTLSISPYKDADKINILGQSLADEIKTSYLYADFKKRNGFKRSLELSAMYGLYRQDYCGCVFSIRNNDTVFSV